MGVNSNVGANKFLDKGLDNLPFIIVQISNLGNGMRSMKIAKNYICAPDGGNILTISSRFDQRRCSWIIETNSDATYALKNDIQFLNCWVGLPPLQ